MKCSRHLALCATLLAVWPLTAAEYWHHKNSPYRAIFQVLGHPNTPRSGYLLEVPVCGLGESDGEDVYVYDDKGRALSVWALGPGRDNGALVLAGDEALAAAKLYAYFGSGRNAPQRRQGLLPGPIADIRGLPRGAEIPSWEAAEAALAKSRRLGLVPLEKVELAYNPVTADDRFIMDIRGFLRSEQPATWELFLVSDDAGYLHVGDELVIARHGVQSMHNARQGQGRKAVSLAAGATPFRVTVFDLGDAQMALLARFESDRKKYTLPPEVFVQSGSTRLEGVEGAGRRLCPAFDYRPLSYMQWADGPVLTAVQLRSGGGPESEWRFGDGGRAKGAVLRRVFVGTEGVAVQVRAGGAIAKGSVEFATVPAMWQSDNPNHFETYGRLIMAEDLGELDPRTLRGYLALLGQRDRSPAAAKVAAALVARAGRRLDAEAQAALLTIARGAAATDPESARAAWQRYWQENRPADEPELVREFVEFELYRGDPERAAKVVATAAEVLGNDDPTVLLYSGELAMLAGQPDTARERFQTLRARGAGEGDREAFRRRQIAANAALEQHRHRLATGEIIVAERALREWIVNQPQSLDSGQYTLVRCQWLRRIGWTAAVPNLVDAMLAYNELPAFLPDLEMEKALALDALGKPAAAATLYRHIIDSYPKHPVAATARDKLK